jgi:hypothetical protein
MIIYFPLRAAAQTAVSTFSQRFGFQQRGSSTSRQFVAPGCVEVFLRNGLKVVLRVRLSAPFKPLGLLIGLQLVKLHLEATHIAVMLAIARLQLADDLSQIVQLFGHLDFLQTM